MQVPLKCRSIANREVVVADRAEEEGLSRGNLAGVVRLEADGRLTVHPDGLIARILPLVVMSLHPVLTGLGVTRARILGLIVPLPWHTAGNVGPRVVVLRVEAVKRSPKRSVVRAHTILRHARHDAVANEILAVGGCVGLRVVRVTVAHPGSDLADINLGGGGFLGRLGSLRSGDLGDDQRTGGGCHDGQGGQGAGCGSCSLGPRVACARLTRCH